VESLGEFSRETIVAVIEKLQDHYVIEDSDDAEKSGLPLDLIEDYSHQIDYLSLFSERIIHDGTRVNKYVLFETLHSKTCFVIGTGKVATSVVRELAENGVGNIVLCADENGISLEVEELSKVFFHT
jgi:molybdopterin/thiamine biosynthesis adenylyltransferase